MIKMVDAQNIEKVLYKEFKAMVLGETLTPIGMAYPPSIPLLEKKNIKFDNMQEN